MQGLELLTHGLQEGVALAVAIFASRGQGGERPGDAVPHVYFWKASASGPGDSENADVQGDSRGGVPICGLAGRERLYSDGPEPAAVSRTQPACVTPGWANAGQKRDRGCTEGSLLQQPLPQQQLGEGAGLAWLGERQFCFLFSGQGGIAVQAALLRLGQREKEKLHS